MRLIYFTGPHEAADFDAEDALICKYSAVIEYFLGTTPNLYLFSPVLYNDSVSSHNELPPDFPFWAQRNFFMIKKSSSMWVLVTGDWQESYGLSQELEYAESIGREVLYVIQDSVHWFVTDARPIHTQPSTD